MEDAAIRRLIQSIKSGAYVLSAKEVAMFHELIGPSQIPPAALEWDRRTVLRRMESLMDYSSWEYRLPGFKFPSGWLVSVLPPSGGVLIRFKITYKDKAIMVSFITLETFLSPLRLDGSANYVPEPYKDKPHWYVQGIGFYDDMRFAEGKHHEMIEAIKQEFKV